jgi:putative spermidine/putrescine transport system substrate-binding protein
MTLKLPRVLSALIAVPLAVGLAACSGGAPSSSPAASHTAAKVDSIVVAHSAGVNGQAVEAIVKDFEAATGIKVDTIEFSDTDYPSKMKLAQQTGHPDFDVATGIPADTFLLTDTDGVYAPIDTSDFDPAGLVALKKGKLLGKDYIVNQDVTPLAVYDPKFAADPPTTWADFFDLKKYPGYRGLASGGFGVPVDIIIALLADGVKPKNLYPLDLDRAFKKLDTIKSSITLWDNAPKAIQDVTSGNTAMTFAYSPAAIGAVKSGQKVGLALLPGAPISRANAAVMQKGPNGPAAGNAFLAYWSKPEVQKKYAELTNYGIVLPSQAVYDLIKPEDLTYAPFVPGQPQGSLIDVKYLTKTGPTGVSNLDAIIARWNEWRAS